MMTGTTDNLTVRRLVVGGWSWYNTTTSSRIPEFGRLGAPHLAYRLLSIALFPTEAE